MSRARGLTLQNALAGYLRLWWPHAESAGAGRNGTDVTGTPGVSWECKTAVEFKRDFRPVEWIKQSKAHGAAMVQCECTMPKPCEHGPLPVVVYFPAGLGELRTAHALSIVPLHVLLHLLENSGYTPDAVTEVK